MLIRALLAFLALPGLVAFVAPLLLARSEIRAGSFNPFSLVLLVPGVTLLLWCVRDFLVTGKGTLAPWDPPRFLVSSGPYRFSRNPMYVGVSLILLGWSMAFESWSLLALRADRDDGVPSSRRVRRGALARAHARTQMG